MREDQDLSSGPERVRHCSMIIEGVCQALSWRRGFGLGAETWEPLLADCSSGGA